MGIVRISSFILLFLSFGLSAQSRMKDYSNIMRSKNIYEINAFLRDAHPDDPRRSVLKPRVMEMMKDHIKNAPPGDRTVKEMQEMLALLRKRPSTRISFEEMSENIRQKQIAFYKAELEALKKRTSNPTPTESPVSNSQNISVGKISNSATTVPSNTSTSASEQEEFDLLMNASSTEKINKTVQALNSLFDNDPNSKECIVMIENKSDCNIIVRIEGIGYTKFRLAIPSKGENSIVIPKGDYLFTSIVCGAQYASQKTIQQPLMVALGNPK